MVLVSQGHILDRHCSGQWGRRAARVPAPPDPLNGSPPAPGQGCGKGTFRGTALMRLPSDASATGLLRATGIGRGGSSGCLRVVLPLGMQREHAIGIRAHTPRPKHRLQRRAAGLEGGGGRGPVSKRRGRAWDSEQRHWADAGLKREQRRYSWARGRTWSEGLGPVQGHESAAAWKACQTCQTICAACATCFRSLA